MMQHHKYAVDGKVLILRRCNPDMTSYEKFVWPSSGPVKPKDWVAEPTCGSGLHGWAWGIGLGDGSDFDFFRDKWIVFSAKAEDVIGEIDNGIKCKAKEGEVIYCGDFDGAWKLIAPHQSNAIRHGVELATVNAKKEKIQQDVKDTQNASSGHFTKNASSGDSTKNASSGDHTQNASSGDYTQNASSGDSTKNASSGDSTQNASSGDYTKNASSGDYTKNASSGDSTKNASSGHFTKNASSGHFTQNASSGDHTQNASSGYSTKNASSGDYTKNASSGDSTQNASSGDYTQNAATGKQSVIACSGFKNTAKVGPNGVFALAFKDVNGYPDILVGKVGRDGIDAGVWYEVDGGKIVPCKEQYK